MTVELPAIFAMAILAALALTASWIDITTRKIPNWLALISFATGLLFAGWLDGIGALPSHLLNFGASLVVGFALYGFKFWGAGDGKLFAAMAAWFPIGDFISMVVLMSLVGLIAIFIFFLRHRGKLFKKDAPSIPYGVAIGTGAALTYAYGLA